jgi:hypothetical protein
LNEPCHLTSIGESAELALGEDELSTVLDLKFSAGSRDQLRMHPQPLVQFLRQTGGLRLIISSRAIGDPANVHFRTDPPLDDLRAFLTSGIIFSNPDPFKTRKREESYIVSEACATVTEKVLTPPRGTYQNPVGRP